MTPARRAAKFRMACIAACRIRSFAKTLFDNYRFNAELRNEAEDQVIVIWALASGYRFAYFDNVHVVYHVHDANSSLAGTAKSLDRRLQLQMAVIQGFERLKSSECCARATNGSLIAGLRTNTFGMQAMRCFGKMAESRRPCKCFGAESPIGLRIGGIGRRIVLAQARSGIATVV